MPRFAYFDGILIRLNFDEHPPPHFHAVYQGRVYRFSIANGEQFSTDRHLAPPALIARLREWLPANSEDLQEAWDRWEAHRDERR